MIKQILKAIVIILGLYVLQTCLATVSFLPSVPDVVLVTVITCGILLKPNLSLAVGFFCGLLFDVNYGGAVGLYAFIYFSAAFVMTRINSAFYREALMVPTLLFATSTIIKETIIFVMTFLFRGRFEFMSFWQMIIVPKMIVNTLIGFFLYRSVLMFVKSYEKRQEEKEKEKKIV